MDVLLLQACSTFPGFWPTSSRKVLLAATLLSAGRTYRWAVVGRSGITTATSSS